MMLGISSGGIEGACQIGFRYMEGPSRHVIKRAAEPCSAEPHSGTSSCLGGHAADKQSQAHAQRLPDLRGRRDLDRDGDALHDERRELARRPRGLRLILAVRELVAAL